MSFDEIFDLTAGVYFNFYNMWFAIDRIVYSGRTRDNEGRQYVINNMGEHVCLGEHEIHVQCRLLRVIETSAAWWFEAAHTGTENVMADGISRWPRTQISNANLVFRDGHEPK